MPRRPDPENLVSFTRTTATTVQLAAGQSERTIWDRDTPGFGLRLRAGGSRVWVIRPAPSTGKYGLFTLGSAVTVNLTEARKAAREHLLKAALGDSPREARRAAQAKERLTFGTMVTRYLKRKEVELKPANHKDLTRHLNTQFASLHDRPVDRITRADVSACLADIAVNSGVSSANRARSVLSTFFVWVIGEGASDLNPVIGTNKPGKEIVRNRVLTDAELLQVWRAAPEGDFGVILRLLILTGQRRDEVAGMTWDELDLDRGVWFMEGERTKNGRPHEVPLSPPAVALLREHPAREGRSWVFGHRGVGPFSGFSSCKDRLDAAAQLTKPWVLHDLRRTASTGMNTLGVQPHVVEAVLNHVSGAKAGVAGVYNWALYTREKREALLLWSRHVLALGQPSLKIVASNA